MIIFNGKILPMEGEIVENGFVSWENGVITGIGPMENLPEDAAAAGLDAHGGWVLPGLVDAHTHLGLFEDSLGFE